MCDSEQRFSVKAGELRALRVRIAPERADNEAIFLDDLPGVTYVYDEARQAIDITVPDALMLPYDVMLAGERRATDLTRLRPTPGFILNYGVYAATGGGGSYVSGNLEALAMTKVGIFSTTGLFNSERRFGGGLGFGGSDHLVRLDSAWRLIDPVRIRSYTIGDFNSGALGWTGSVRLAGFQIQSAFEQRTDLVTTALPQFSGSAALPSSLDLYVNNMKVFSGQVPSGPFDVKSLPYISGGDVRLVTTDATGRQVEMTKSYYYAPGLLKPNLTEFSVDVGMPRYNYGLTSFDYYHDVYGSASVRHGISRRTTLEGHIEGSSDGLVNGGVGIVQALGGFGAVAASAVFSSYKGDTGAKFKIQGDFKIAGVRAFAGTERTSGTYFDLSRLALVKDARRYSGMNHQLQDYADWLNRTARASVIDRAGISFQPWFDPTSISLSYNRIKSDRIAGPGRDSLRTANVSASRRLNQRFSIYASSFADLDDKKNYGIFATLNIRLGNRTTASLGIERNGGRTGYTAQASGSGGQRQGEVTWSVANREYDSGEAWRSASLGYRAGFADVRGQIDENGGTVRGTAQIEGSIVAAGGGVFPASRIGEAFAIVRNAGPGTPIRQGGALMAKANGAGSALLPDLQPYYETTVSIDPTNLPQGWEPRVTELTGAAGFRNGTILDFGARPVRGAVIVLVGADGKPLSPGYVAHIDGAAPATADVDSPGHGIIGYDGEVYIRGLGASNRLTVDLGTSGSCQATFPYDPKTDALPKIGPLTCK